MTPPFPRNWCSVVKSVDRYGQCTGRVSNITAGKLVCIPYPYICSCDQTDPGTIPFPGEWHGTLQWWRKTKVLHFINNLHVIMITYSRTTFILPDPGTIRTSWKEMYQVFNMGHRMELYVPEQIAEDIIRISQTYNIDAQIVGGLQIVLLRK